MDTRQFKLINSLVKNTKFHSQSVVKNSMKPPTCSGIWKKREQQMKEQRKIWKISETVLCLVADNIFRAKLSFVFSQMKFCAMKNEKQTKYLLIYNEKLSSFLFLFHFNSSRMKNWSEMRENKENNSVLYNNFYDITLVL